MHGKTLLMGASRFKCFLHSLRRRAETDIRPPPLANRNSHFECMKCSIKPRGGGGGSGVWRWGRSAVELKAATFIMLGSVRTRACSRFPCYSIMLAVRRSSARAPADIHTLTFMFACAPIHTHARERARAKAGGMAIRSRAERRVAQFRVF